MGSVVARHIERADVNGNTHGRLRCTLVVQERFFAEPKPTAGCAARTRISNARSPCRYSRTASTSSLRGLPPLVCELSWWGDSCRASGLSVSALYRERLPPPPLSAAYTRATAAPPVGDADDARACRWVLDR